MTAFTELSAGLIHIIYHAPTMRIAFDDLHTAAQRRAGQKLVRPTHVHNRLMELRQRGLVSLVTVAHDDRKLRILWAKLTQSAILLCNEMHK